MPSLRWPQLFRRTGSALRRWWSAGWFSRVPDWLEKWAWWLVPERVEERRPGRPKVALGVERCEDRFYPDDLTGMAAGPLLGVGLLGLEELLKSPLTGAAVASLFRAPEVGVEWQPAGAGLVAPEEVGRLVVRGPTPEEARQEGG